MSGLNPAADFRYANFEGMNFSNCDLKGFDFTGCDFTKAVVGNASFQGAIIKGALFSNNESPRRKANQAIELKRKEIVNAVSSWIGDLLVPVNLTCFESRGETTRVVCTISKRFDGGTPYWFAYHPRWNEFLSGVARAYFVLGCMDLSKAFVIPRATIISLLDDLHISQTADRQYWHIHIGKAKDGSYELVVPRKANLALEQYELIVQGQNTMGSKLSSPPLRESG